MSLARASAPRRSSRVRCSGNAAAATAAVACASRTASLFCVRHNARRRKPQTLCACTMQQSDAHDAATLVAKLRASSSSADTQGECCTALRSLRLEGEAAADAIDVVVAALRHSVDHAALQNNGCGTLLSLMRDSANNRVSAAAAGAVEAIVAGLHAHPGDAGVQTWGCTALGNIAACSKHVSVTRRGAAGAVEVILAALHRHPGDTDVQCYGWMALGHIMEGNAGNATTARAAGAVEAAVAALKRHSAQAFVLGSACFALNALSVNCADRAATAGAAGAVKAVIAALRAFPDDVRLQCFGCASLIGLLETVDNRRRAFGSGTGEAIIAGMRTHAV